MKTVLCDVHKKPYPPNNDRYCVGRKGSTDSCFPGVWVKLELDSFDIDEKFLERFVYKFRDTPEQEYAYTDVEELVKVVELILAGNYERTEDDGSLVANTRRRANRSRPPTPGKGGGRQRHG